MNDNLTYKDAGVDTTKKDRALEKILKMMKGTYGPSVMELPWGFAGLFSLNHNKIFKKNFTNPVLVACTDGVGTKLKVAFEMNKHDTIGIDLVAMSVNDLIVTGGEPLFFLDYLAFSKIDESILLDIVKGIVNGCKKAGCALLGGETAEMPGFYPEGEYEMAGFACGIAEKNRIINGSGVRPGNVVVGIFSSGMHSNGYSLARKVFFEKAQMKVDEKLSEFKCTLGEELLKPTRIYVKPILSVLRAYRRKKAIRAIANITGGGMTENIPRVLPPNCSVEINKGSWEIPQVFKVIHKLGGVPEDELYKVFNMGIGMILITDRYFAPAIVKNLDKLGEKAAIIGQVVKGGQEVKYS